MSIRRKRKGSTTDSVTSIILLRLQEGMPQGYFFEVGPVISEQNCTRGQSVTSNVIAIEANQL